MATYWKTDSEREWMPASERARYRWWADLSWGDGQRWRWWFDRPTDRFYFADVFRPFATVVAEGEV